MIPKIKTMASFASVANVREGVSENTGKDWKRCDLIANVDGKQYAFSCMGERRVTKLQALKPGDPIYIEAEITHREYNENHFTQLEVTSLQLMLTDDE